MAGSRAFFNLTLGILLGLAVVSPGHSKGRLPVIVLDAGHGGKDPGAIGRRRGVREKDIALTLAKKVARSLEGKATVRLTRSGDRFVSLGERDRLANRWQCDLFVSLHANASRRRSAEGIEIYFLNNATDEAAMRLARRENEGAPKKEKEIETIVSQLILNAAADESAEAAGHLRRTLRRRLKSFGVQPRIKTALFYVLVGAKCPSLLVESGFLTNSKEEVRLKDPKYQDRLAAALAEGILGFLKESSLPKGDL